MLEEFLYQLSVLVINYSVSYDLPSKVSLSFLPYPIHKGQSYSLWEGGYIRYSTQEVGVIGGHLEDQVLESLWLLCGKQTRGGHC